MESEPIEIIDSSQESVPTMSQVTRSVAEKRKLDASSSSKQHSKLPKSSKDQPAALPEVKAESPPAPELQAEAQPVTEDQASEVAPKPIDVKKIEVVATVKTQKAIRDALKLGKNRLAALPTATFTLNSNEPWDTFCAQLMAAIYNALKIEPGGSLPIASYDIFWTIPRYHTRETELGEEPYNEKILTTINNKKGPPYTLKVRVDEKPPPPKAKSKGKVKDADGTKKTTSARNKDSKDSDGSGDDILDESSTDEDETGKPPKKAKCPKASSSKVPKEAKLTPHAKQQAVLQQDLETRWVCTRRGCKSEACYEFAEHQDIHLPLTAELYAIWVEAIIGDRATLDEPPNHRLFDLDQNKNSALQHRRANQAANHRDEPKDVTAGHQNVFNINVPPDLFNIGRRRSLAQLLRSSSRCTWSSAPLKEED